MTEIFANEKFNRKIIFIFFIKPGYVLLLDFVKGLSNFELRFVILVMFDV